MTNFIDQLKLLAAKRAKPLTLPAGTRPSVDRNAVEQLDVQVQYRLLAEQRMNPEERVITRWFSGVSNNRCDLCRKAQKPKAMAKGGRVCLSCSMRHMDPRSVYVGDKAVVRWRLSIDVTGEQLAAAAEMFPQNLSRIERARRIHKETAVKLATGFVKLAVAGKDLRRIIEDWPLFVLLVPRDVVSACIEQHGESDL